jgi:peptidoglycan hydrolase-like protein with peptidoglycan-binding domain
MMKTPLIALFAAAALSIPALAQDRNANPTRYSQGQTRPQNQMQPNRSEDRRIQQALNKQGFSTGHVDGIFGPDTRSALKNFQKQKGINPTGQPTRQTVAALGIKRGHGNMQRQARQGQAAKFRGSAKAGPEPLPHLQPWVFK